MNSKKNLEKNKVSLLSHSFCPLFLGHILSDNDNFHRSLHVIYGRAYIIIIFNLLERVGLIFINLIH